MKNLAPEPAYGEVLREMAARMWRRIHATGDFNMVNSHYGMFRYAPVGPTTTCPKSLLTARWYAIL